MHPLYRILRRALLVVALPLFVLPRVAIASSPGPSSSAATSSSHFVLRLRFPDGSVERIGIDSDAAQSATLTDIFSKIPRARGLYARIGSQTIDVGTTDDTNLQTLTALGLRHGSILTLVDPRAASQACQASKGLQKKKSTLKTTSNLSSTSKRWDPFPDLAKQYHTARRQLARRRQGGASYGDLARLQSELHVVQAQPEGPVQRVYMCRRSAEALASSLSSSRIEGSSKAALLLGTLQRERKEAGRRPRTSLSSTTADQDFITAAKVHALWQPTDRYDEDGASGGPLSEFYASPAHQVATWLGLVPVGWIFTYPAEPPRHANDGLPVWGKDVQTAAILQIGNMQQRDRVEGARFVTLAMDGSTGATEAFQLSDVAVQMTAEGVFLSDTKEEGGRFLSTSVPVLVDGKETHTVDSVLCLVNTALLSHEGWYADGHPSAVKKTGGFTKKVKKRIAQALLQHDDAGLLKILCNFVILVALAERLTPTEAEHLVTTVRKYARGQTKSTKLDMAVKQKIGILVES